MLGRGVAIVLAPKKGDGCGVRDGRASAFAEAQLRRPPPAQAVRAAACGERERE